MRLASIAALGCALTACTTVQNYNELGFGTRLAADLTPDNESGASQVKKQGELIAALNASGRLCYRMVAGGDVLVESARVREVLEDRPSARFELVTPQIGKQAEACTLIDQNVARRILREPSAFQVEIFSDDYEGGRIAGILYETG